MKRIALMKKALTYLMLMFIAVVSVHKPVSAEPTANQRQNQRFEIEQKIENLDMQIEEVMDKIEDNKKQRAKIQEDIKSAEKDLKQAEGDIEDEQELYNERMRVMYMNGSFGYLDVILGAKDLSDLYAKIEAVKKLTELDKEIVKELKEKQESLNDKKDKLNKQNGTLVALNKENNEKLNKLKADKEVQKKLIEEAERQDRLYAASIEIAQSEVNKTLEKIETKSKETTNKEIANEKTINDETINNETINKENINKETTNKKSTSKVRLSRGSIAVSGSDVVAYASKFLGTPYLWGGTTPEGFDCSGFTQYVYKHFGINVGRTTKNQIYDGYAVSRDQLQPGDLVFYGKNGIPSHMGIYIGDGMYIHAPRTGDVIKISPYDRKDYITARRVIR